MNIVLEYLFSVQAAVLVAILIVLKLGIKFVPQNRAYIVERFGKYNRTIEAGINMIVPFIDSVAHDRSLKEQAVDVPSQGAITKDNISLTVDGVLYFRVLDPYKASYGVEDYAFAVTQLAQTTMRSEIGKIELDKTFEERDQLNANIVNSINQAAETWGVQVLRYEIKDIVPPQSVMSSM
ncbi:paraslipin, partial [Oleiphilus sp. HI0066]|uniref:paraslipin n=1 Tax=Oleiphilus sp. HI0066 TaxID=1822242 RepID=UPI000AFEACAC